ncbi:MAG: polysaccharide deacetylase family protein [Bacillota bacterium]
MQYLRYILSTLLMAAITGCGNPIEQQLQRAVVANKTATSLLEWELSPSNPELLFAQWREESRKSPENQKTLQKQICDKLRSMDGLSLTIFEQAIKEEANRSLVMDCKGDLLAQLERHYAAERSTLKVQVNALKPTDSGNNFQFPTNVQTRDTSKGYYARAGDVAPKEVILSFDDGPSSEYTPSILRTLKEVNAKAHFFELAKNVRRHPDVTKMVAADGHAIGTHSISHRCLASTPVCSRLNQGKLLSFDDAVAEIRGGHQSVFDVLGWVEPFFRFPYGEDSLPLKNFLAINSTAQFAWNIDSEDWRAQTNEEILKKTLAQIDETKRGIVLFHDIQRRTAEILPQFLRELYNRGYSVVLLQPADPSVRFNSKLVKKPLP